MTPEMIKAGSRPLRRFAESVDVNMDLEEAGELAEEVYRAMCKDDPLRNTFAAHAITGLYAAYAMAKPPHAETMARWAYDIADAMMNARGIP